MPVSDLTDADIDAVYSAISPSHRIDTAKEDRRAQLAEQERTGKISVEVMFGEIFITSAGGRMVRIKQPSSAPD